MKLLLTKYNDKSKFFIDLLPPLRTTTKTLLEEGNYENALVALKLLIEHDKDFFNYFFNNFFNLALKNNAFEFIDRLLVLTQGIQNYSLENALIQLSKIYITKANYEKVIDILQLQQPSYSTQQHVKTWVINLINNGKIAIAAQFIDKLIPSIEEKNFVDIIESLISKEELNPTIDYLQDKIKTPGTKIRLQHELKGIYLTKLKSWLEKDSVHHLVLAQQKLAKFIQLVKQPENEQLANQLKNEIITDLRSQLDKAFLAFCRNKYGEPPSVKGNFLNVFFPVIPDLKGKSIRQRLNDYFQHKLFQPNFAKENSELFQYLEFIQPLENKDYLWLKQLYDLANKQKHDKDLPLYPNIAGVSIDMNNYLPKLIDGIVELLLKLKYPQIKLSIIRRLKFSQFSPLTLIATSTILVHESFGLFHTGTTIHNSKNSEDKSDDYAKISPI